MQLSNIITTKVVIVLRVYNSRTYVNKGLSKSTRAKNIVAQLKNQNKVDTTVDYSNESSAEKLLYVYSGDEIDIKDPNGYYLMNSGYKIKGASGVGRTESKAVTQLLEDIFHKGTFQELSQSTTSPSQIMQRAVDLNGKLHASTAQKTQTFSTINDLKESFNYLQTVKQNNGKLFIFDTETIGGKNRAGVWNPLGITEFAMQEYDFGTQQTTATNIVLGVAPTAENKRVYQQIIDYMEAENWRAIETNEELRVTAMRAGLYADAEMALNDKGFYEISRLGESNNDWKSISKFKKGWENLEKAYNGSTITDNGLRAADQAIFDTVFNMQTALNQGNAMALGQNFQIFDEPVVNSHLKRTVKFYQDIIDDTTGVLGKSVGIERDQAQKAMQYMQQKLVGMGGGLNLPNKQTFDTLPLFRVSRDYFGVDTLYNGNKEAIKKAGNGIAKQEYIGAAWFQDLFSDAMAHMADFDVTVLNYAATQNLPQTGGMTLLEYLMTKAGTDQTGVLGIDDKVRAIKTGQIYYSNGKTSFDFAGKGLLNFTHNEKTGEIFTSSGYKFVNGKSLGYEDAKVNMGTNLTKGNFYTLDNVMKVKASDIHEQLGDVLPDMSGTEFVVAKFKMALPEGAKSNGLEDISYNYIFNSEKQFSAFMSTNLNMAVDFDENGQQVIVEGMKDIFDMVQTTPDGEAFRMSEFYEMNGRALSDKEMIQRSLKKSMETFQADKAYNSILDSDKSYKKISQMMDAKNFLQEQGLENITQTELRDLLDGKQIRNLDNNQTEIITKKLHKTFGFNHRKINEQILYSNTQRNIVNAWDVVQSQDKFFNSVLQNLNKEAKVRGWNEAQTSIAFNDLVETMRVQAAELISTGNTTQDKRRITGRTVQELSERQLKSTYDVQIPLNFSIDTSARVMNIESNTSGARDIIRLNLDNNNESFTFVNKIRNAMYGEKELPGSIDTYNRRSLRRFVNEVLSNDDNFAKTDALKNIRKAVSEDDFNIDVVARDILGAMSSIKEKDITAGILREVDIPTLNLDPQMIKTLNSDELINLIGYNISNNLINPIDTRSLLNSGEEGMKQFVNSEIMKFYMPDRNAFNKTLEGLTDQQKFIKNKLYDTLYEDISAQLTDIFSIGSKIEDGNISVSSTGQILFNRGNKSVQIKSIPQIKMDNGHLYGVLGNQELNVHLEVGYNTHGQAKIKSNLGEIFERSRYVSNNIKRDIETGDFRMDSFFGYVNKLGKEFREEASYSGTSGEQWANYFVGTKELNKVLPNIFADEGAFSTDFVDSLDLPDNIKSKLRDKYNKEWNKYRKQMADGTLTDELDPAFRQVLGPFRVNLMRALADAANAGDNELSMLLDGLNFSTKDKSKAGKDILMGGGFRFHTGFTNALDENSRPVIGGSGNVFYLEDTNLEKAASKAKGLFYKGALFESDSTRYINKTTRAGIGDATTTFTGRTAYVGEIGIRQIVKNNFNKIMNDNTIEAGTQEQKEKIYNYLNSFLNTFEQAKVFSAETFDDITGGNMAANKQRLSLSKDLAGAIDPADPNKKKLYDDLWNLKGKLVRNNDGTIAYIGSDGKIVKHGDAILPYATFGGGETNWVSKMDQGVLRFEIADNKGRVFNDEQISSLLNQYSDMFEGFDFNDEKAVQKRLHEVLEMEGLKSQYVIEDINKTTLPKILINDAEKSMNHLGYMRIGSIDTKVAGVLEEYGDDTAALIGKTVPTEQALRAFFSDKTKLNEALNKHGFNTFEDFMGAVREESYAADRMLFGKGGIFEGFVAIGNDNLAGHKNKGSMMTGAVNEAIAMLGKYENGGVESQESFKKGLERFVEIVNNGTAEDKDKFKFFKSTDGKGYEFEIVDGSLMLKGHGNLGQGFDDADILDSKRLEDLFEYIDETVLKPNGAKQEDRLVHYLDKLDDNGNVVLDADGKTIKEKTVGRLFYTTDEQGNKTVVGSIGSAGGKIVKDSETQSGMTQEYIDVKRKLQGLIDEREDLYSKVQGRNLNEFELEKMAIMNDQIDMLEQKARDLQETGHLYRVGDRERNIFSQAMLNDDTYSIIEGRVGKDIQTEKGIGTKVFAENEALRGLDYEKYSNDYKVFGFLEDELMGQKYFNPYEERRLTKEMLEQSDYAHLKGVYKDIVETRGKNLGVKNAEEIYGLRMVEMAQQYNNNLNGLTHTDLEKAGFKVMTPEQYSQAFGSAGADNIDNVVRQNVLIDLGEEFDTMKGWEGKNRYVAVPGMGSVVGDADIKKDWHAAASRLAHIYEDGYLDLAGQETAKRGEVIAKLSKQVDEVGTATASYAVKKNLVDQRSMSEVYSVLDRTKIMSLPDQNNPLLEQAMVHGKSIAQWQKEGVYYDAAFDSYEMFKKRGFFNPETIKQFGMENESEMVDYLKTHGAVMVDDRYPNIRDTSLTTVRHYLMDSDQMHATNATYLTKETLLKILGDSDGDSRSGFVLAQGEVTHAQYEHARLKAIESMDLGNGKKMAFASDTARENYIKEQVVKATGLTEEQYSNFRGIDVHSTVEAATTNVDYHQRAIKTNIEDFLKTRKAQTIVSGDKSVIAELAGGRSILGREKFTALAHDPTAQEIQSNIDDIGRMFNILKNNADQIEDTGIRDMVNNFTSILDVKDEVKVLDDALFAMEGLKGKAGITDDMMNVFENTVRQRVRIGSYHSEILSKLGISAVGNVNFAFYGATQAIKNYYGTPGTSNADKAKAKILTAMGYEIEQSSISSKKIQIKAGDTRVLDLNDILNRIKGGESLDNVRMGEEESLLDIGMNWMRQYADKGKAIAQYENITSHMTIPGVSFDVTDKSQHDAIADYMYEQTLRSYSEVYNNDTMRKVANAYSKVGTRNANPHAIEYARGMLENSLLGQTARDISGVEPDVLPEPTRRTTTRTIDDHIEAGRQRHSRLEAESSEQAMNLVRQGMNRIRNRATANVGGSSAGRGLAMGALGLAVGLIAAGYASGNPLNDANPEQVAQEQTKPKMSFGPEGQQFAPNNTGGYIINIKGDTSKGNRQLKKALKQAANASVGGGVNINMNLKTSREGGYSNNDIENILNNYF